MHLAVRRGQSLSIFEQAGCADFCCNATGHLAVVSHRTEGSPGCRQAHDVWLLAGTVNLFMHMFSCIYLAIWMSIELLGSLCLDIRESTDYLRSPSERDWPCTFKN